MAEKLENSHGAGRFDAVAGKIKDTCYYIANGICCVALLLMVILIMIVVVGRYFFRYTPSWSEELSLFFMTWVGLFSSCIAEYKGTHIRLSFIDRSFPPALLRVFGIVRHFLKLFFFVLMTKYGIQIFNTTRQKYGAVAISYKWAVLPGIVTAVFFLIFLILNMKKVLTDTHIHDKEKSEEEAVSGNE